MHTLQAKTSDTETIEPEAYTEHHIKPYYDASTVNPLTSTLNPKSQTPFPLLAIKAPWLAAAFCGLRFGGRRFALRCFGILSCVRGL